MRRSPERGYSLLELLIGMGLLVGLSAALFTTLRGVQGAERRTRAAREELYRAARVFGILSSTIRPANSHPLHLPVRVDSPGQLLLQDGSESPAAHLSAENSNIVSAIDISLTNALCVTEDKLLGAERQVTGCPLIPALVDQTFLNGDVSFAGLSFDGLFFFRGRRLGAAGNGLCRQFILTGATSLHLPQPPSELPSLALLLPVERDFSLLVDRHSVLRWISYRGALITENQPVLEGLSSITGRTITEGAGTSLSEVRLAFPTGRVVPLTLGTAIGKPDHTTAAAALTVLCRSAHG